MLIAAVACTMVPSSRGAETQEPEEWIFSVLMPPQWTITNAIFAYQFKGAYYLPVIELAEAYEFFVEAETDRAFVTGFAGREENSFTLDGERGELIIKGESQPLPADAIIPKELVAEEDIYVRIDILNRMWPVEMKVDLPTITIIAEAEEELSFVRRKEREDRQAIYEARQRLQEKGKKEFPFVDNDYKWFGKPILDIQTSFTYDNREKRLTGSSSVSGTQQLGKFIADYSANYRFLEGKLRRPDSIRTRFLRQAPGDEHLFIPTLKRLEFGDVTLSRRDLVGNSSGGRGVIVSNKESNRSREFDRITVEGRGPPGWELELYNNNQLLRFGVIEDDGEYRFEDVILNFGNNRIRVIMYGPQGQIREDVYEYDVGRSLMPPGDYEYRAGIVDTGRPFIRLEEPRPDEEESVLSKSAELFYGLNKWLTVFGSYTRTPFDNEIEQYYTGGLALSTPVGVAEVEGYRQINGGNAVDARLITQLFGIRLNTRGAFFSKFESQNAGTGENAKRFEAEIQANTRVPIPFLPMSLRLNLTHREFVNGTVNTTLDTAQSFTGGGIRFNHSTSSRFVNEIHESSNGSANINWNKGDWQTRGTLNYDIYPVFDLNSGNAEIRYRTKEAFQAALTFQHSFRTSTSGIGAQIGYDFDDILSSFDAQYQQERGWQFILRASTSLNPYYPDKSYRLSSRSQQGLAPALGRVFIDRDNDGTFTAGDEPLKGAKLNVDRARSRETTDENGYIVVPLRPDQINNISVEEASLIDPYFKPSVEGYSTIGIRGTMPGFEFPVVETGAIDGTVWREPSGNPVPGMTLQLVKPDGEVYMTTETAFDGYYAFEFVLPGTYTVRADPSYQVNVPPETVEVSSDELFAFGIDLYLLEPAAEESAAAEPDGESGRVAQTNHAPAVPGTEQSAPVSLPGGGSSPAAEEPTDEDSSPVEESADDGGSSSVDQRDSGGGVDPSLNKKAQADMPVTETVNKIRIGEHPDKVRVVLDLSDAVDYEINEGETGMVIVVDIPGARWQAKASDTLAYNMTLKGFGTEALPNGGTRLLLIARDTMKVKDHQILPAKAGKAPRLMIDLQRK